MIDPLATAASVVTVAGGIAGLVAWRRKRKRDAVAVGHQPIEVFEVRPLSFKIDLFKAPPFVEVELYAINYSRRRLTLTELEVTHLSVAGCPPLEQIHLVQEFLLEPRRSTLVSCRRHLADSEARSVTAPRVAMPVTGSVSLVARAKHAGREFTFGSVVAQRIEGGIQVPAV
jgi:hypothetical protein